jgi:hypothetical protein
MVKLFLKDRDVADESFETYNVSIYCVLDSRLTLGDSFIRTEPIAFGNGRPSCARDGRIK